MSVIEFSADAWQASAPSLQTGLARRMERVSQLAEGLESLAASGNISGQGADAMRAYIREVHIPILKSLLISLSTFQTAIGVYWDGYRQVDNNGNFRLVKDEYDAHLTQLESGMETLRGFGIQLQQIAVDASHLVSLDGAGAKAAEQTADDLQKMHSIVKRQKDAWEAYEASDPGFAQVHNMIAELSSIMKNIGTLTVGRGRSYTAGSFSLTLQQLDELATGMSKYCTDNQERATAGWEDVWSEYADDVEAAEREKAGQDLILDVLQIATGAVIAAIGLVASPFSAGTSLFLAGFGASLVVGGINSTVNHVSIVTTGNELNLVGMASETIGQWYDVNVVKPAMESDSWGAQFLAGVGSGIGQAVSGAAQLTVRDIASGVNAIVFEDGLPRLWNQVTKTAGQVAAGNGFVIGELAGVLIPGAAVGKAARATSLLGKAGKLPGTGGSVKISTPSKTKSALDWGKGLAGLGAATVRKVTESTKHVLNGATDKLLDDIANLKQFVHDLAHVIQSNFGPAVALAGTGDATRATDRLTKVENQAVSPPTKPHGMGGVDESRPAPKLTSPRWNEILDLFTDPKSPGLKLGGRNYLPTNASNKAGSTKVLDTSRLSPKELEEQVRDLVNKLAGGRPLKPVGKYDPPEAWSLKLDDGTIINLRSVSESEIVGAGRRARWTIDFIDKANSVDRGWPKYKLEIKFS